MSYKKTVNYSKVMKAPTTFKIAFWKINLPWTFKLETTMLYVFSFLVVQLFFHFPLKWLGGLINNLDKVGAFGLPYLLTVYLIGQPTDGKPIFYFVKDTIVYFLMEKLPKKKYCNEEAVEWTDETIEFSELKVERRKGVELNGEVNFTAKNDSREFIVNK